MALNKKITNIVFGLDPRNFQIKIFKNFGSDFNNAVIELLDVDPILIENKSVYDMMDRVLLYYLSQDPITTPHDAFFVLPDYFVATDIITLPILKKSKQQSVLVAEIKKSFSNFAEYKYKSVEIQRNKKQITYAVTLVKKEIITDIQKVCQKYKLNLKCVTFSANAIINSFNFLSAKRVVGPSIILNIDQNSSKVIYALDGKTISFNELSFGQNFLSQDTPELLPTFVESPFADQEIFTLNKQTDVSEPSFWMVDVDGEDAQFFKHYKRIKQREKIATERFLFAMGENNTILQNNFAVFARHLYAIKNSFDAYSLPLVQNVIVNLPDHLASAINIAESDLNFVLMKSCFAENCLTTMYLDLFGAILYTKYNKNQNFASGQKKGLFGVKGLFKRKK